MGDLLCIGGPHDGMRVKMNAASLYYEVASKVFGSYAKRALVRRIEFDEFSAIERAYVLMWEPDGESVEHDAGIVQGRLMKSDWHIVSNSWTPIDDRNCGGKP